jgi:nanoRNase/pAp phosphatase (c-di-AMP/oligoRNAs hydrolase)
MIRFLGIPLRPYTPELAPLFSRHAIVDSQPQHNPDFRLLRPSVIIDHHPLPEKPHQAEYCDIRPSGRPNSGTTSAILSEYLRHLRIRPGARLATALQYGIRTDTAGFTRTTSELDLHSYIFLGKTADPLLLRRIMHSEYLPEWLKYFSRAFNSIHKCGSGRFVFASDVETPDILVVVADFFSRVHGLHWVAVGGVHGDTVVLVFRGNGGSLDMGALAAARFGRLGSAGGHRGMARAEFPLASARGRNIEMFIFSRLTESVARLAPPGGDAP